MERVAIVGIGLIGGSFAKGIKRLYPTSNIAGFDTNESHLEEAMALGLIDKKGDDNTISESEMVLVTIPVDVLVKELPEILNKINEDCVVIDAGSTKALLCQTVEDHPRRRNYLSCHPIAGTEFSGPSAAFDGLYEGKTNIICEVEKTAFKLQEKALNLFQQLGMRIRYMNPEAHDKHIAYVSHLSHISSFMLGKTVIEEEQNERDIFDMAGSGFESTVRLAKSSPDMWTPIFEQNKANVVRSLQEYIKNLEAFKQMMEEDDFVGIYDQMNNTNRIQQILKGIPLTKTPK